MVLIYIVDLVTLRGHTRSNSAAILSIIGATSTVGRILAGWLSDRPQIGSFLVFIITMVVQAIAVAVLPWCYSLTTLAVCAGIIGLCSAASISLRTVILVDAMGIDKLTHAFGLVALLQGLMFTIAPPIGGMLYDIHSDFVLPFELIAVLLLVSSALATAAYCVRKRQLLAAEETDSETISM